MLIWESSYFICENLSAPGFVFESLKNDFPPWSFNIIQWICFLQNTWSWRPFICLALQSKICHECTFPGWCHFGPYQQNHLCVTLVYNTSPLWLCAQHSQWFEWLTADSNADVIHIVRMWIVLLCQRCQPQHGVQTRFLFLTVCWT